MLQSSGGCCPELEKGPAVKKLGALGLLAVGGAAILGATLWYFTALPGPRHRGPLTGFTLEEETLAQRLRGHVEQLSERIGPRPADDEGALRKTVDYLEGQWQRLGYSVRRQKTESGELGFPNLEVEIPGTGPGLVVVSAHYDTVPGSPGADDDSSGLAVLLELSRSLHGRSFQRSVRLVAFADEERHLVGSRVYASSLRASSTRVDAMLSLEMLGFYCDAPGSQRYPLRGLSWLYPDRADFVGVVGNPASRRLLRTVVGTIRNTVVLPCEGMTAPELLRDIGRSDNRSFWQEGYPAVMVTDTSNFRNPNYHRPSDTVETLDFKRMARLARALPAVVERLAGP